MQRIEGVGLASVACYLSLHLDVLLPHNIFFLGEVQCHGQLYHPTVLNEQYLELCVKSGFNRIVGPSSRLEVLQDEVDTNPRYMGIELIGLNNALEIVHSLFLPLRLAHD